MAWWNPKTWNPKPERTDTPVQEEKTAVRSIDIITTDKSGNVTGGGYVDVKGTDAWRSGSGGGGSGITPASQVVKESGILNKPEDASFSSQGSTYDPATDSSSVNKPTVKTYDPNTGTWSGSQPYQGSNVDTSGNLSRPDVKMKFYSYGGNLYPATEIKDPITGETTYGYVKSAGPDDFYSGLIQSQFPRFYSGYTKVAEGVGNTVGTTTKWTSPLGLIGGDKVVGGITTGIITAPIKKPFTTLVSFEVGVASAYGLGLLGEVGTATVSATGLSKLPYYGAVTSGISTGVKIGLPIVVGGTMFAGAYSRAETKDTYNISKEIGISAGSEIIPFSFGFVQGSNLYRGSVDLSGRKKIDVVSEEVKAGETFYTAKGGAKVQRELFIDSKYNLPITKLEGYSGEGKIIYQTNYKTLPFNVPPTTYHVTPEGSFMKSTWSVVPGTSEFPAISVSSSPATYFSKLGGEVGFYGGSIFPTTPRVAGIVTTGTSDIVITQAGRVPGYTVDKGGKTFTWALKDPKYDKVNIPGGSWAKPEVEGLYPYKSGGEQTSFNLISEDFYVIEPRSGSPILLDVFKVAPPGAVGSSGVGLTSSQLSSSYSSSGGGSYLITPGSLLSGLGLSSLRGTASSIGIPSSNLGTSSVKLSTGVPTSISYGSVSGSYFSPSFGSSGGSSSGISSGISSPGPSSGIPSGPSSGGPSGGSYSPPSYSPPTGSSRLPPIGPPMAIFPPFGGLGNPGTKIYKGKRKFKYTPSFESFIFNIRGKAPKGREMGLRLRPITPGFSFASSPIKTPTFIGSSLFKTGKRRKSKKKK